MKEIIEWLKEIEHAAHQVYLHAAEVYKSDELLGRFLKKAAEDEAWHYHVMGSAADYVKDVELIIPAVKIDDEIKNRIAAYFYDIEAGLKQGALPADALVEKIVEAELSEWNDIFLYVVNTLKEKTDEYKYPAARFQAHLKRMENFIKNTLNRPDIIKKLHTLPPVWIENILIVDDYEWITELLKGILNRDGRIDTAGSGLEAIELIDKKYYKLIITDIDMPGMDGISLYKSAAAKYPALKNRFLFMSAHFTKERLNFFAENQLKFLEKPMEIGVLREAASKIILSN